MEAQAAMCCIVAVAKVSDPTWRGTQEAEGAGLLNR